MQLYHRFAYLLPVCALLCVTGCTPKAAFEGDPLSGPAPLTVQFTDQSEAAGAPIVAWHWTFGDGQTASAQDPNHTYSSAGQYGVSLTVTAENGASDTMAKENYIHVITGEGEGEGEGELPWPGTANAYSWDGSWQPESGELPPEGLYDDVYFDGHLVSGEPSPTLPPGLWDWEGSPLVSWRAFESHIGGFLLLDDTEGNAYGWRLEPNSPEDALVNYWVEGFQGSSGTDVFDLGAEGQITLTEALHLGEGPDMIRYRYSSSASYRTGSSSTGGLRDNDLVIAGSLPALAAGNYDILSCGFHTGPGRDLVFISNLGRAGVDTGNGADGRTDTLDPLDGGDMVIINGNAYDFRVFCGAGSDVIVWFVDEVQQDTPWLGPNLFGAGGWGAAVWDTEVDRLVLGVPLDTPVLSITGSAPTPGTITLDIPGDYPEDPVPDAGTEADVYGRYYYTAGIGPLGEKTVVLRYVSTDGSVQTGFCGLTAIEELQVGIGAGAQVYRIDESTGAATLDPEADALESVPDRAFYEALFDAFVK